MKKQRWCIWLLSLAMVALAPARANAAATLSVVQAGKVEVPADGKSVRPIVVQLRNEQGALDGKTVKGSITGDAELVVKDLATLGGKVTFFVRATGKPGAAKVTIEGEGEKAEIDVAIVEAGGVDLATLAGRLGTFFLMMMLLSLGAEKAVDFFKAGLCLIKPKLRPKPRLAIFLGKDESIGGLDLARCLDLCKAMNVPTAEQETLGGARMKLAQEDDARGLVESLWTWLSRVGAAGFGITLACVLKVDVLEILAPIGVRVSPHAGYILTGLGASAGASFWQDLLDKLSEYKKKV